jgi:hypothetical protein
MLGEKMPLAVGKCCANASRRITRGLSERDPVRFQVLDHAPLVRVAVRPTHLPTPRIEQRQVVRARGSVLRQYLQRARDRHRADSPCRHIAERAAPAAHVHACGGAVVSSIALR